MTDWARLVKEHGDRVWATAYRLLNHHADAQDCYQEVFLAACQMVPRDSSEWGAILTCLVTRKAIDRLRVRSRLSRTARLDSSLEPVTKNDPMNPILFAELTDRLRSHLAQLPEKQAEVVWLSCVEEWEHQKIADRLGVPTGEVRVLLHRGRQRLRDLLAPNLTDTTRPS